MKLGKIVITGIMLAALVACGKNQDDNSSPKIYGGKEVPAGAWTNVVGLAFNRGGDFYIECTGTLIHPHLVLTAGHCLDEILENSGPLLRTGMTWDDLGIYVGPGVEGGKLPADAKLYRAHRGYVHEKLRALPRGNADVGLLVLEEAVTDTDSGATIQLHPILSRLDETQILMGPDKNTTIVGFGQREDMGRGRKFEVEVPVVEVEGAEALVGGDNKDSCSGDSGGPVFARLPDSSNKGQSSDFLSRWRLAGVVSRGLNISCGQGGIVTLTPDYICWIQTRSGMTFDATVADSTGHGCEEIDPIYDAKKLRTVKFLSICKSSKTSPMQRHTVDAVMLKLRANTCEQAAEKLNSASTLDLRSLRIRDLSPIANAPNLRSLNLEGNKITEISVLSTLPILMSVNVAYNDIKDFSPVSNQISTGLIVRGKRLQVSNFLETNFKKLCDNPEATADQLKTVRSIRSRLMTGDCERANLLLARQKEFRIANRQITDLSPFKNLENLTELDLSGNPIADISPLAECENLKVLDLTNTNVTDISPLVELLARGLEIRRSTP